MTIKALVAREDNVAFEELEELPPGELTIDVAYSSLNYKDGLAVTRRGKIVRRFPMVLGIDLAGTTEAGEQVVGNGQGLGESEPGGYTRRQRVRADAVVPLPAGMTLEQSMQLGTAGFTAMLCVQALERNNVRPDEREVIVTGAAGGVGSIAVLLLAKLGYRVAASTGRPEQADYLRGLGATTIIEREELAAPGAPMQKERWAGAVDTVGGVTLANVYAQTAYGGAVACCGMAGGHELTATVWPLILRNVSLLGVSSLRTPRAERIDAWNRLARDIDFDKLAELSRTEPLSRIFELSEEIMGGGVRGRVAIDVGR
ncbi:MAG TPA: MDR family oxidoreductase [Thermoanaerobaculia bacterium]|jgi:acrylyl-CoA reductase (NADPH)